MSPLPRTVNTGHLSSSNNKLYIFVPQCVHDFREHLAFLEQSAIYPATIFNSPPTKKGDRAGQFGAGGDVVPVG